MVKEYEEIEYQEMIDMEVDNKINYSEYTLEEEELRGVFWEGVDRELDEKYPNKDYDEEEQVEHYNEYRKIRIEFQDDVIDEIKRRNKDTTLSEEERNKCKEYLRIDAEVSEMLEEEYSEEEDF